jgi:mono/diheme cytochrome c family protein
MRASRGPLLGPGLLALLLGSQIPAQENTAPSPAVPDFLREVRPLLRSYCFECHSTNKRRAGLDLEKLDTPAAALDFAERWEPIGERLLAKDMPPAKRKQPTEAERQQILAWVKHAAGSQVRCDKLTREQIEQSLAGYTMSRRLTRFEYNNTLHDLFGIDLQAGALLPSEGGGGEGFDNTGATLFTTPVLLEKYLEAGELVLGTLLPAAKEMPPGARRFDPAKLEAARRRLLVAAPGREHTPREAARKVIEAFLPRAFRRPPTGKEVEVYLGLFDKASRRGDSFEQSLKLALKGVLISPSFLFLTETPPDKEGAYRLGHYEVAGHLSYFLWSSMPDEELLRLASQGKLHDEKVLREQVRRMARSPRARGLANGFAAQWLGIQPLGVTIRPDARLFPEFTDELAEAMREETVLFFDSVVREDRSVLEIIAADYTFVNEALAALYKIPGVKGPEMRRVRLDDPSRGGVLGHASVLTVTSFPHRTSPVLRGRWILDELLGAEIPPPPPDVPVLTNNRRRAPTTLTLRQQLEKHRAKPECASCHQRIDPLGFGLENFDPLGRWRTEADGKPIDTVGVLPSGEKFTGPVELKKLLLDKRRPDFLRNLARKMLGYALGREVNRVDLCVVADCVKALEQGEYRASRLLEAIVVSYPFSHRYHKK